jgi:hypothetical protein
VHGGGRKATRPLGSERRARSRTADRSPDSGGRPGGPLSVLAARAPATLSRGDRPAAAAVGSDRQPLRVPPRAREVLLAGPPPSSRRRRSCLTGPQGACRSLERGLAHRQPLASPFAGAPDLNPPGLAAESGVLFMEGEGEPTEIRRLTRDLKTLAGDMEEGGQWLSGAMEKAWPIAGSLAAFPELADLLGERHRIIANDWQAANEQALIARLLGRALEIVIESISRPRRCGAISPASGRRRPTSTRPRSCSIAPRTSRCTRRRWSTTTSGVGGCSANASES